MHAAAAKPACSNDEPEDPENYALVKSVGDLNKQLIPWKSPNQVLDFGTDDGSLHCQFDGPEKPLPSAYTLSVDESKRTVTLETDDGHSTLFGQGHLMPTGKALTISPTSTVSELSQKQARHEDEQLDEGDVADQSGDGTEDQREEGEDWEDASNENEEQGDSDDDEDYIERSEETDDDVGKYGTAVSQSSTVEAQAVDSSLPRSDDDSASSQPSSTPSATRQTKRAKRAARTKERDATYQRSVRRNERSVVDLLNTLLEITEKSPPRKSENKSPGYVYAIRDPELGLVKIGATTQAISNRLGQIRSGCKANADLYIVAGDDNEPVFAYQRLEKLIHEDLQPHRWYFNCLCGSKKGRRHREYFKIDDEIATRTLKVWKDFIKLRPYGEANTPGVYELQPPWPERCKDRVRPLKGEEEHHDHEKRLDRWTKLVKLPEMRPEDSRGDDARGDDSGGDDGRLDHATNPIAEESMGCTRIRTFKIPYHGKFLYVRLPPATNPSKRAEVSSEQCTPSSKERSLLDTGKSSSLAQPFKSSTPTPLELFAFPSDNFRDHRWAESFGFTSAGREAERQRTDKATTGSLFGMGTSTNPFKGEIVTPGSSSRDKVPSPTQQQNDQRNHQSTKVETQNNASSSHGLGTNRHSAEHVTPVESEAIRQAMDKSSRQISSSGIAWFDMDSADAYEKLKTLLTSKKNKIPPRSILMDLVRFRWLLAFAYTLALYSPFVPTSLAIIAWFVFLPLLVAELRSWIPEDCITMSFPSAEGSGVPRVEERA